MAELATITRPYAEALYKASAGNLADVSPWLDELATIACNQQLLQFADSPKVTSAQVFELVTGVAKSVLGDHAKNFLRTVIDNDRLGALPEIAAQFRALKNAQSGSSDAVVFSAFPIDQDRKVPQQRHAALICSLFHLSHLAETEKLNGNKKFDLGFKLFL